MNAFDQSPVPESMEDLNIGGGNFETKYDCEAGTYPAIAKPYKITPGKKNDDGSTKAPRLEFEYVLTSPEEKGIRARQSFLLDGQWNAAIAKFVKPYGIVPVKNEKGEEFLPLKDNADKIVGVPVQLVVAPRTASNGKVYMDAKAVKEVIKTDANDSPF